ncbi:MAG: hypothetical protein IJF54_00860 [Clostridia bacterium]|nr:hypothetical protein [Clostridia bacterium]
MTKNDILEKSRKENQNGDEMETKVRLHSYGMSAAIGGLICMAFVIVESIIFDRSTALIWTIYSGMYFSKSILDAVKLKKKIDICLSILWGLVFVLNIVSYILDNIG